MRMRWHLLVTECRAALSQATDVHDAVYRESRVWSVSIARLMTTCLLYVKGAFDAKLRVWYRCCAWAGREALSFPEVRGHTQTGFASAVSLLHLPRVHVVC
jgi:hypothetical protein